MSGCFNYKNQFANNTYIFVSVSRTSTQTTSTALKGEENKTQAVLPSTFAIRLGILGKTSFVSVENVLTSVAIVTYNERDTSV